MGSRNQTKPIEDNVADAVATTEAEVTQEDLEQLRLRLMTMEEKIDELGTLTFALKDALDRVEENKLPVGVSNIDPNMNFQTCLQLSMNAFMTSNRIAQMNRSEDSIKDYVNLCFDTAETLHKYGVERYMIDG